MSIISENDDHKKSPNSQYYGFLWSSFSYTYIHKDDHKKSPNSQFHGFLWSSFSYIYIRMIIRSHRNWPVASYDHHFHKLPPFLAILSKNSGFEACTACPIYARITPGHQLKRSLLAISYGSRTTLLIWAKSFSRYVVLNWYIFTMTKDCAVCETISTENKVAITHIRYNMYINKTSNRNYPEFPLLLCMYPIFIHYNWAFDFAKMYAFITYIFHKII